jgi:hypothetical protein
METGHRDFLPLRSSIHAPRRDDEKERHHVHAAGNVDQITARQIGAITEAPVNMATGTRRKPRPERRAIRRQCRSTRRRAHVS